MSIDRVGGDRENPLPPPEAIAPQTDFRGYGRVLRADPCAFCGETAGTLDHIRSQSAENGPTHWTNLTGACPACNLDKGADTLLGFLLRRCGLLDDGRTNAKKGPKPSKRQKAKAKFEAHAAKTTGTHGRRRLPEYW